MENPNLARPRDPKTTKSTDEEDHPAIMKDRLINVNCFLGQIVFFHIFPSGDKSQWQNLTQFTLFSHNPHDQ
jgi:hypothetical protein